MNNNIKYLLGILQTAAMFTHISGEVGFVQDHPHHVAILYKNIPRCGGSIISKKIVITTGQCIFNLPAKDVKIRAESNFSNKNGTIYSIQHIKVHPKFNETTLDFDLAMLEVDGEIVFTKYSRNIKLWNDVQDIDYRTCHVLAWNNQTNKIEVSNVSLVEQNYCQDVYFTKDAPITNRMFCSHFMDKDFCQNDVGGSLICRAKQLIGIRSWGYGCNFQDFPQVFTNILTLGEFIRRILNDYNILSDYYA